MSTQVVTVSSKGQIAIPIDMRKEMSIESGDKLIAFSSEDYIILKVLRLPSYEEFKETLNEAKEWAASVGLTEDDVNKAIKSVRAKRSKK